MPDLLNSLPFATQILRAGEFQFKGKTFTAPEVVERLQPLLTEGRKNRIEQVLQHRTFQIATVAEHLYDIGNISAVMRSAESFGFLPFHIVERPEAKYKMSDRISRGSEKWLDIRKHKGSGACINDLRTQGYQVFATDLSATHKIEEIDFSKKVAVVFGNEKEGISEETRQNADGTFIIPMYGFAQSFNISVAAALCFYHIHQARVRALGLSGDLSEIEAMNVRAHYYMKTLDSAVEVLSS